MGSANRWTGAIAAAEAEYGPTDVMFANAGIARLGDIGVQRPEEWDEMIDINIKGVMNNVTDPTTLANYKANKAAIEGGIGPGHVADLMLHAYALPQRALVQEICITPTRQKY